MQPTHPGCATCDPQGEFTGTSWDVGEGSCSPTELLCEQHSLCITTKGSSDFAAPTAWQLPVSHRWTGAVPLVGWPGLELWCCRALNATFPSAFLVLARAAEQPFSTFLCSAEPELWGKQKRNLIRIFQTAESVLCISFTPSTQKQKANVCCSDFSSLFRSKQMSANPVLRALLKISPCQQTGSFPLDWSYLFIAEKVWFYIKLSSLIGNLSGRVRSRHAMLCSAVSPLE